MQQLQRLIGSFKKDGFGDFNFQPVGFEPACRQSLDDHLLQPRAMKLDGRDIDRDPHILGPRRGLAASLPDHPWLLTDD